MDNKLYVIGEVLDNDTQKRSEKWGYRVGRECYIKLMKIGVVLVVEYPDGRGVFSTSIVENIEETDYGVWVKTMNRTYRFDEKECLK